MTNGGRPPQRVPESGPLAHCGGDSVLTEISTTNWAGNVTYRAHRIHHPASVPQLPRIIANSRHIRALGTRHTFNTIADSPGDLVSLAQLPSTVDIDPDRSTATVSAGMRYGELAPRL